MGWGRGEEGIRAIGDRRKDGDKEDIEKCDEDRTAIAAAY